MPWHLSRLAAPGVSVVAGAAFLLPLAVAFADPDLPIPFKLLVAALLFVSTIRPLPGLLALVLVLPFATWLERLLLGRPTAAAITDALLLAFLAGASVRIAWPRSAPPVRLAAPVVVLLAAIVTSTFAELHALQAITPRQSIVPGLWRYLVDDYWTTSRQIAVLHEAVRWIAWLVVAAYAERLVAATTRRSAVAVVWIGAGLAGAALTASFVGEFVLASELAWLPAIRELAASERFSVLQPDLNAAGSHFLLFLLPAAVIGIRQRSTWLLAMATPLVAFAFLAARSRAAIVAVVLVACAACAPYLARSAAARRWLTSPALRLAGLALVAVVLVGTTFAVTSRSNVAPQTAVQYRLEMTQVALEGIRRYPVFGVGLGDYIRTTRRFITPELALVHQHAPNGENAHNNFLQIAVELGMPALLVFLWLVLPIAAFGFRHKRDPPSPALQGMSLGLAAFLVSALFGHPLLISQVGAAFFIALGITAGLAPTPSSSTLAQTVAVAGVLFYALALLWRLL